MQKILVIIPCFNEANRMPTADFVAYFKAHVEINVCFVNDGSSDGTLFILKKLCKDIGDNSCFLDIEKNVGKAEAVRLGFVSNLHEGYDYIGFFDADLATPLEELDHFLETNQGSLKHDMVIGSRMHRMGANIVRIPSRHYLGRVFSTFASLLLRLQIYDTQCGAKLFSQHYAQQLFNEPFISKWLFDIELISRAIGIYGRKAVKQAIIEIPLNTWIEKGESKIKPLYFIQAPFDLIKIAWIYRKGLNKN